MKIEKEMKQVKLRDSYQYFWKRRVGAIIRSSLTSLIVIFCFNATLLHAESIEEFCLTQYIDISKNGYMTESQFPENQPKPIELTAKGETFFLEFNNRRVILKDAQNNEVSTYSFKQSDGLSDRDIEGIFLDKKGWLWIDGNSDDYYAYVDTSTAPPTIKASQSVAKGSRLKDGCGFFSWIFPNCENFGIQYFYSKALGRFFVFGRPPAVAKMVQIVEGKPRPVPVELEQAYQTYLKKGKGFSPRYINQRGQPPIKGVSLD